MKIRLALPEDAENILKWNPELDMDALLYPTTDVVCAENGKPIAFLPVHLVGMLEGLVVNPSASKEAASMGTYEALDCIAERLAKRGARELYFFGDNEELARQAERLGFEKIEKPVYCLKLRGEE